MTQVITGSYDPADVTFLLKPVEMAPLDVTTKERLIQQGKKHYSEMISEERRPDQRYLDLFESARAKSEDRMAREVSALAHHLATWVAQGKLDAEITLCSLVRAGVPYGVLLQRELVSRGLDSVHFGLSIIRDRGLDQRAIEHILAHRPVSGVVFVDGWTGKGTIATELQTSWRAITQQPQAHLVVLADPSGFAALSGSHEDWLIPSGILGANVSGLISRSILNRDLIGPDDFHGAIPVRHLADLDVSRDYVDRIAALMPRYRDHVPPEPTSADAAAALRSQALACVHAIAARHQTQNLNRIKPGIAEATRAVLRRKPEKVYVRSKTDGDLAALIHLCHTDDVDVQEAADLTGPYRAITLISKIA